MTYACPCCDKKLKAVQREVTVTTTIEPPETKTEYILFCADGPCPSTNMNNGTASFISFEDAHDKLTAMHDKHSGACPKDGNDDT